MPWRPRYTREEAAEAIARSSSWADALRFLGLSPRGKNFATIRKWAARWEIPVDHLPPYRPGRSAPRFSEAEARTAIAASNSWSEALRRLDYCPTGGNPATLRAWAARWGIPTDHFESPDAMLARIGRRRKMPIEEILVQGSTYNRSSLKARLYDEGLKQPVCELCGQDEIWRGRRMGLILDHISGVRDDNRLENLRIICPNCAATLDTHCGRKHPNNLAPRSCLRCGTSSDRSIEIIGIAHENAGVVGTVSQPRARVEGTLGFRTSRPARWSARRTSSYSRRSSDSATWRLVANTA
jgi:hypothetical protein